VFLDRFLDDGLEDLDQPNRLGLVDGRESAIVDDVGKPDGSEAVLRLVLIAGQQRPLTGETPYRSRIV
jgi:hypothetical protein